MESARVPRVLMIGLDAAEPRLIAQWTEDGSLPTLRRLKAQGAFGRLASPAGWLTGSPWPTFHTGTHPSEHGFYDMLLWRADLMAQIEAGPDWLPLVPFWRDLSRRGPRIVAIDVPMGYAAEPFHGVEVSGWATHDRLSPPSSHPPEILSWVRREFGEGPMQRTVRDPRRSGSVLEVRDRLIRSTERCADLAITLMRREPWDLFLWCLGETHRGGHQLWGYPGAEEDGRPRDPAGCLQALKDVYIAADAALGRALEAAPEGTTCLVFSAHGMGVNNSRAELVLPRMLSRVLTNSRGPRPGAEQGSALDRLRRRIPVQWRTKAGSLLPKAWQDRLTAFWRIGHVDWSTRRAFSMYADATGYIRVNLRGREKAGIVEPGEAYDRLCAQVAEGLGTFVDADTGQPIVERVERADRLFPAGPRRQDLPDLIVRWVDSPAASHRAISSPTYGTIAWPTPGSHPDHRSGNHRGEGFLIAAGDRIAPGAKIEDAHILDLVPTLYALFGVAPPAHLPGRALPITR
jgi:predicted AlkP superfamily phosphohydrolase/phosphomutase